MEFSWSVWARIDMLDARCLLRTINAREDRQAAEQRKDEVHPRRRTREADLSRRR